MEELEALLKDLESSGTPRDPPKCPQIPPGTPPGQGLGGDLEQLYSSVRKPLPPPGSPPPPGLGELERLLRDLSVTQSGLADELLAPPPEDGTQIRGSPPLRESGTPPGPPKFGEGSPKSSATAELDRLLASLAEFHLQAPQGPPEAPSRELCRGCGEPVRGQALLGAMVTALGQTWHPEHFCCSHCGVVLGDQGFLERGGRPFCRRDFGALFGGRCRACGDPVLEAFVAALGGLWHPQCFVCQDCGSAFPGGSFFQRGGAPVCRRHFREEEPTWGRG